MTFYRKRVFPVLAGLLWAAFLTLDLTGWGDSTWVKFAAICLCCVTALLGAKTPDGKLVAVALCLTVGADWFLLVVDRYYALGIGLFIVVQLFYAYRLYCLRGKEICKRGAFLRKISLVALLPIIACLLSLILFLISVFFDTPPTPPTENNPLFILASFILASVLAPPRVLFLALPLFYFLNLCINTFEAFAQKKRIFAWGLLLFACCDICVGAYNLDMLPTLSFPGMWFFYLPSQVLIVLSQETGDTNEKAL